VVGTSLQVGACKIEVEAWFSGAERSTSTALLHLHSALSSRGQLLGFIQTASILRCTHCGDPDSKKDGGDEFIL
jgi:hypothetical protein